MSTPSLKKYDQLSPLLASGDNVVARKLSGERAGDSGHDEQIPTGLGKAVEGTEIQTSASTTFPVDETLFQSAPSRLDVVDQQGSYQQPISEDLLPPPDFRPFFMLIEDPETGEHYHPAVHYVFSDDAPDVVTNASLDALDLTTYVSGQHAALEERIVVLDVASDGKTISSASSLSPHWQALQASVTQAPSWGESALGVERGLMLKVNGQVAFQTAREKDKKAHTMTLEDLVRTFSERLAGLDEVLGPEVAAMAQEQSTQS